MLKKYTIQLFATIILVMMTPSVNAVNWSKFTTPTNTKPYTIGKTNNGCISGAKALPLEGDGYLVVHLERGRHYGHPLLIQTLQQLGIQAQQQQIGIFQIGDLGQARGGSLPFGHRSHQSGLDADVWFNLKPESYTNLNKQRSNLQQPSMLTRNKKGLNSLWTDQHRQLLKLAANIPEVDRIFVNPRIKQDLCKTVTGNRQWLQKIRPWYHHDDHFHIRLHCPQSSPDCIKQAPLPAGESCNASLAWWFVKHPPTVAKKTKPKKRYMPSACKPLLTN
ncbi:MAG: penicillin-insensitive murein endopeptidase [Methylococcales bacterium]|nr:penicillin-insensitive murein endopeptidase [Methylococcales bacterium]